MLPYLASTLVSIITYQSHVHMVQLSVMDGYLGTVYGPSLISSLFFSGLTGGSLISDGTAAVERCMTVRGLLFIEILTIIVATSIPIIIAIKYYISLFLFCIW